MSKRDKVIQGLIGVAGTLLLLALYWFYPPRGVKAQQPSTTSSAECEGFCGAGGMCRKQKADGTWSEWQPMKCPTDKPIEHKWASELDGKVEKDGCRWQRWINEVVKQCPTGQPEQFFSIMGSVGADEAPPAWKDTETYRLDWCILHSGETRVLKNGKPIQ